MVSLLWLITILQVVLWVLGYAVNIGAWINFLLIAAVVLLLFNVVSMFTTRRAATHVHDTHERHLQDDDEIQARTLSHVLKDLQIGQMRPEEQALAAKVLGCAFATEPNTVALFGRREEIARRGFEKLVEIGVLRRSGYKVLLARLDSQVVGVLGMIEWPRCQMSTLEKLKAMPSTLLSLGRAVPRGMKLMSTLEKRDPRLPHWHIGPVGVQPELQGRGIGSRLLASCLESVDARKLAAYLETAKPENVRLYQRFGFVVTGEDDVNGVHIWYMWRESR